MPDREKVIKGLEHCTNGGNGCFECPYSEDGFSATTHCKLQIDRDALKLLKEQEAFEPKKESEDMPEKWASWWYVCGNCGREIDWHDRYCRHCGKAVKWDE